MRAIVREQYGSPDAVDVVDVDRPAVEPGKILIRIRAAGVNPADWHIATGTPYLVRMQSGLRRPKDPRLGIDFAGEVAEVGVGVTRFKPGDRVFGAADGAFAEYVLIKEDGAMVPVPPGVSFEQAAAVPVAAQTALQGFRKAGLRSGQRVLIIGAGGGVGTFAVQLAVAEGAHVTGVCSGANDELVRSLGASEVIDYTKGDYTLSPTQRYDLIFDTVGTLPLRSRKRLLAPGGKLVAVSGRKDNRWVGPMGAMMAMSVTSPFSSRMAFSILSRSKSADLETLSTLMASGKLTSVLTETLPLSDARDAIRRIGGGHTRGKIVLVVE